ncbi:DUF3185 domain-containing protein [Desulfococcus sp.]|uniref:DUF3185 domain-containing protein n=1 Tax=Desulfococcus sp. TaxID=2025834 RepID=UPI0035931CC7
MRTTTILAIILIAVGIAAFGCQEITFATREKVVDLGPLQMTAEKISLFSSSPIFGGISLLGYIGLMTLGRKKG